MTHFVTGSIRNVRGRLCAAGLLVLGCGEVLGIHDPVPRAPDAEGGDAGEKPGNVVHAGSSPGGAAGDVDSGAPSNAGEGAALNGGDSGAGAGGEPVGGGAGTAGTAGGGSGGLPNGGGGMGGSGPPPVCADSDPLRCNPDSPKTPEECSSGQWVRNPAQNNGMDCPVACNDGVCGECSNGDVSCKDNYPRTCTHGAWVNNPLSCADWCAKGSCQTTSSCVGVVGSCNQESCCLSLEVTGNSFWRDTKAAFPATVSSFTMDKYEVTVERFKRYRAWYFGPEGSAPAAGAGKSAHFAADPGWITTYPLPERSTQGQQDMDDMLSCVTTHGDPPDPDATYVGTNPFLPINCVSFYVAYALCIWDGGRLPTEAEWSFAATTSEQRVYPWSNPATSPLIDSTYAVYGNNPIQSVGSLPAGRGLFGQLDLAGNLSEWTLDYWVTPYPAAIAQCNDCIDLLDANSMRSVRGGSYMTGSHGLTTSSNRSAQSPEEAGPTVGFRCVHDL